MKRKKIVSNICISTICIYEEFQNNNSECSAEQIQYLSDDVEHWVTRAVTVRLLGKYDLVDQYLNELWSYCRTADAGDTCKIEACIAESYFLYEVYPD